MSVLRFWGQKLMSVFVPAPAVPLLRRNVEHGVQHGQPKLP
jgi:hypothetical protein